ncbi:MAG: hypothetical protein HGN29_03185 [Asgard group archaeon]|nr:hypothetical protein [Asgard group archaeon]
MSRIDAFQDYIDDTEEDKLAKEVQDRRRFGISKFKESKFYGFFIFLYIIFLPIILLIQAMFLISYSFRRRY